MLHMLEYLFRAAFSISVFPTTLPSSYHELTEPTTHLSNQTIPGGSPLRYCHKSRTTDLYQLDYIELHPNPLHMYIL